MRILRELDYLLLAATLVMVLLGVTMIYSAAFYSDSVTVQTAWDRQAKFAFLALAVALAAGSRRDSWASPPRSSTRDQIVDVQTTCHPRGL